MGQCCQGAISGPSIQLDAQEEDAIKDAFQAYDTNKNNVIEAKELRGVLTKFLGREPTQLQLSRIFKKVDLNQDGLIDFSEFRLMIIQRKETKNKYVEMFQQYDIDHNGYIERNELKTVLGQVGEVTDEDVDEIIALADKDKDGRIDFLEFLDFWC